MDSLVAKRVIVLGGPVGDGDGDDALLVVAVETEAEIRGHLAEDPWVEDLLTIKSVEAWSVWLRAPGSPL